jgi:site-specific DNA recombinase
MRQSKKLIPHTKEAEVIKSIFETYVETGSLAETYKMLKEEGIKNRPGKNFSKTNIAYILRNVVYVGKIKHNNEIDQGVHEPIVSEKIFALAQKIHKEKQKRFRVYKNFLFGGLIKCEECGSNMTSCFTNKYIAKNLNRYYYYRCTATMKQDWQACSVKQVSAERLENFCLENLERISVDKKYIENLVFRLNNDEQAGYRTGSELTDGRSKFSTESISDTLKFFLAGLKTTKGIERNLFAKKFLSNIFYSPKNIKIRFICRLSGGEVAAKARPAPPLAGLGERTISSSKDKFVPYSMAPETGLEPVTHWLTASCSTD